MAEDTPAATRCGFIALLGAPNAGKSTLLNALVGAKVTIVSRKVQTTRALIRGIAVEGAAQLIFVDTPGIFAPRRRLDRAMVQSAWTGAHDADLIAVLIDARKGLDEEAEMMFGRLVEAKPPKILVLNKIDVMAKQDLLALAQTANQKVAFDSTFMLSALTGDGVVDLKKAMAVRVPPGPWLYPAEQMSDAPIRQLAAEITREQIYERLHQELPYHSTVETDAWKELRGGAVRIEQTIFVERESQRKIVLGEGGRSIKSIGEAARKQIADILGVTVHLFLHVKVRENWGDDPARYGAIGLEFPKD